MTAQSKWPGLPDHENAVEVGDLLVWQPSIYRTTF